MKEAGGSGQSRYVYTLTEKGRELKAVTDAMGSWGARWLEMEPQHVDAAYVLWATCKLVDVDRLPKRGLVVRVDLADRPAEPFWMLLRQPHPEMCSSYLGWVEDLNVHTDSETLAHWHLRHISYEQAVLSGQLQIDGPPSFVKAFLRCLRPSPFAGTQPLSTEK